MKLRAIRGEPPFAIPDAPRDKTQQTDGICGARHAWHIVLSGVIDSRVRALNGASCLKSGKRDDGGEAVHNSAQEQNPGRLLNEQGILDARRQFLERHLPQLQSMVTEASCAYQSQDIDALSYLNIESALINKRVELLSVELAVWEIEIALDTVAARAPLP